MNAAVAYKDKDKAGCMSDAGIASTINWSTISVLIIDDQIDQARRLSMILQKVGVTDARVLTETHYAELLIAEFKPRVVLLGEQMAPSSTLRILRAYFPNIPVIMIGVGQDAAAAIEGLHQGACDFLVKPLTLDQVNTSLHRVLFGQPAGNGVQKIQYTEALRWVDHLPSLRESAEILISEALRRHNGVLRAAAGELMMSPQAICNRRRRRSLDEFYSENAGGTAV